MSSYVDLSSRGLTSLDIDPSIPIYSIFTIDSSKNHIQSIEPRCIEKYMVYRLELDYNPLDFRTSDAFLYNDHLNVFTCVYCHITQVYNETFTMLPNLKEIDLSHNRLTHIAEQAFDKNVLLKKLILNGNSLRNLSPYMFVTLRYFKILSLNDNRYFRIGLSDTTLYSTSLEHLSYSNCRIRRINEKTFQFLPQLKILNLTNNRINYIPNNSFQSNDKIEHIYLNNNRLRNVVFPYPLNLKPISVIGNSTY